MRQAPRRECSGPIARDTCVSAKVGGYERCCENNNIMTAKSMKDFWPAFGSRFLFPVLYHRDRRACKHFSDRIRTRGMAPRVCHAEQSEVSGPRMGRCSRLRMRRLIRCPDSFEDSGQALRCVQGDRGRKGHCTPRIYSPSPVCRSILRAGDNRFGIRQDRSRCAEHEVLV